MLEKPKFKECFHVEVVAPENVFLLTENSHWVLSGAVYRHVAPLLDGQHTLWDIVARLEDKVAAPRVLYAIEHMAKRGYITEANGSAPPAGTAFWNLFGLDAAQVAAQRKATRVLVRTVGEADARPVLAALQQVDVRLAATAADADFTVVVADDYLRPELAHLNEAALRTERAWMVVRPAGQVTWIGPVFRPGHTACWHCLAQRLRVNRQLDAYLLRNSDLDEPIVRPLAALPANTGIAAHMAATEIAKFVMTGRNRQLEGQLLTYSAKTMETVTHTVVQRPQCPACGDPERYARPRPVRLSSRRKTSTNDGGHRSRSAEATVERYKEHVSPITGVVNWLVDITGDTNGLAYSYVAGHNFALIQNNLHWLRQNLRSRTGGKGMTDAQARASALGEAMERYSGVFRGTEFTVRGNYRDLAPKAIHLEMCLNYSAQQYAQRHAWNESLPAGSFHVVPNPFDETQTIDWTPVWSLTNDEERYVPSAFCYFGHPDSTEHFFCAGNSSGCAAGNNLEEAILQGFLELVERDSVALWWYNRLRRPAVDLDSFQIPYLADLAAYYDSLNRTFWVLDLTADLEIPTFAAVSRRTDRPVEDIILGFGSHLDPTVALLRAVTEMNQFLPAVTQSNPDGSTRYAFPDGDAITWWQTATLANQPYLQPDDTQPACPLSAFRRLDGDDLRDDVETCVALAQRADLETFVLDLTRPDVGMSVCRVIVPGLRHFWRRLGPGRLYDVPVQLGWRDTPTPEAALNPRSVFF